MATLSSLEEITFPVELIDNPMTTNSEYSRIVRGITPELGEMDLNYCSPRYELVPNSEIFPQIEEVLKSKGIEYKAKYRHVNHVRFYADLQITDERFAYDVNGKNDIVYPSLMVQHSYNGLTKYRIMFGFFRFICSNGLVIPLKEMMDFNLVITGKHTSSIKLSISRLNNMLENFTNNADEMIRKITDKYELLGGVWVADPKKRIEEVLEATKISALDSTNFNTVNHIYDKIKKEADKVNMGYNGKINDWLIYNGINQYINDDARNKTLPEKRIEKDIDVLEFLIADAMA